MALGRPGDAKLGIHWTIGDVNPEGFEALRLSIMGAAKIFASAALYLVCVNSISAEETRDRTGLLPVEVQWREVRREDLPPFLHFGAGVAEGTGWKFCPLRAFADLAELSIDNDCILWEMPGGMARWLEAARGCLIAEDVRGHFGAFAPLCGTAPRNSGIRGITPEFPFEELLSGIMAQSTGLATEGDEQGLQVAAIQARGAPELVRVNEVTICSPFPPHLQALGSCGVHFVGLNTKHFNWSMDGENPVDLTRANWRKLKPLVEEKIFGGESRG
jgi:hypothetical protein